MNKEQLEQKIDLNKCCKICKGDIYLESRKCVSGCDTAVEAMKGLSKPSEAVTLSKEVFEYCHSDEVSGEWIGYTIDVALMKDHAYLKRQIKQLKTEIEPLKVQVNKWYRTWYGEKVNHDKNLKKRDDLLREIVELIPQAEYNHYLKKIKSLKENNNE